LFWKRAGGAPRKVPGPLGLSWNELRRVLRFGFPNGINWFLEFAAFQLFINVVMARLGTDVVAAFNIALAINSLSFMPAFGLSTAGAILAGQAIGGGQRPLVWQHLKLTLACAATWMGAVGLLYLAIPGQLISLFSSGQYDPRRMIEIGTTMLVISAAWQLFDAVAMTFSETLRAAGDTAWTAGARLVLAWLVFAPSAYIAVGVLDGGPVAAMVCLAGYLALLAAALVYRFRGGAWRKIELIEPTLV
jgi:MATE family multidrug resistance protein